MILKNISLIVGIMIFAFSSQNVVAENSGDFLVYLSQELEKVRSSNADKSVSISPVPTLEKLIGLSKAKIISAFGEPDVQEPEEDVYLFIYLPPGWRGGGPELFLKYSDENIVEEARWHFSR